MQPLKRNTWMYLVGLAILASVLTLGNKALASDWPQWFGPKRDGVWRETGLIDKFPAAGPSILWRTPLGSGYSGPAVAGDRVYVLDRVRAAGPDGKPLSGKEGIQGKEGLLCLNAVDGKVLWRHEYDCLYKVSYPNGPRTTPVIHENRVYALGAMGDLFCLEADTGKPVWTKNLVKEYKVDPTPLWGYAAHLLIEGDLLYSLVGGEGSAVVAFDRKTGREVWKALTAAEIGYSPPMLFEAGGRRQLIVWHVGSINGLDPLTGKLYWKVPYPAEGKPHRPTVNIATVRREGQLLFLCSPFHGPMMLKFAADKPDVSVLWRQEPKNPMNPEGLSSLMSSPVLKDGHVYGVAFDGALLCLEAETGKKLWQTYDLMDGEPADCGTAFLVPQGDRYVIFTDKGDLILATLTSKEYKEVSRAHVIEPAESARGRKVVWSHPAFALQSVFIRNDKEIIRVHMASKPPAQEKDKTIAPDLSQIDDGKVWRAINAECEAAKEEGKTVVRLMPKSGNKPQGSNVGLALVEGLEFAEGTVEIDLKGKGKLERTFLGVAFNVLDGKAFEAVYFRPFNFMTDDPVFRARAVQYVAWPDNTWEKLRRDKPGTFESAVKPVPDPSGWFHARIEVTEKKVSVWVDDAKDPCLVVDRLNTREKGKVGLWVDSNEGAFRNLKIRPAN